MTEQTTNNIKNDSNNSVDGISDVKDENTISDESAKKNKSAAARKQGYAYGGKKRGGGSNNKERGNSRQKRGRDKSRSEFDNKVIGMRRVTRVVAGGRRFSFSVAIVVGDRKGSVGVGLGKASDTALAIEKATRHAKKNMIKIRTTKEMSIPHDTQAKYASSIVSMRPAPGRGLVAGGSIRAVLDLAGVRDIGAKILSRSKNPTNNARAAIEALKKISAQL